MSTPSATMKYIPKDIVEEKVSGLAPGHYEWLKSNCGALDHNESLDVQAYAILLAKGHYMDILNPPLAWSKNQEIQKFQAKLIEKSRKIKLCPSTSTALDCIMKEPS